MDLHGKVILITGGKGGLGTFVTNSFLESGAQVFGVSRSIADSDFPHLNFTAVAAELSDGERTRQVAENMVGKAGVYGASKAALVSLIRTIARENADVHVSA